MEPNSAWKYKDRALPPLPTLASDQPQHVQTTPSRRHEEPMVVSTPDPKKKVSPHGSRIPLARGRILEAQAHQYAAPELSFPHESSSSRALISTFNMSGGPSLMEDRRARSRSPTKRTHNFPPRSSSLTASVQGHQLDQIHPALRDEVREANSYAISLAHSFDPGDHTYSRHSQQTSGLMGNFIPLETHAERPDQEEFNGTGTPNRLHDTEGVLDVHASKGAESPPKRPPQLKNSHSESNAIFMANLHAPPPFPTEFPPFPIKDPEGTMFGRSRSSTYVSPVRKSVHFEDSDDRRRSYIPPRSESMSEVRPQLVERSQSPTKNMLSEGGRLKSSSESNGSLSSAVKKSGLFGKMVSKLDGMIHKSEPLARNSICQGLVNIIVTAANGYLMEQYKLGRISVESIRKVERLWIKKGRAEVTEFLYDQETQRDLILANLKTIKFHRGGDDQAHIASTLSEWGNSTRIISETTFRDDDRHEKNKIVQGLHWTAFPLLQLLGAPDDRLDWVAWTFNVRINPTGKNTDKRRRPYSIDEKRRALESQTSPDLDQHDRSN